MGPRRVVRGAMGEVAAKGEEATAPGRWVAAVRGAVRAVMGVERARVAAVERAAAPAAGERGEAAGTWAAREVVMEARRAAR